MSTIKPCSENQNAVNAIAAKKANSPSVEELKIDCGNGARKCSLASAAIDLLDETDKAAFMEDFEKIGLAKMSARLEYDNIDHEKCCRLVIEIDGESEHMRSHSREGSQERPHEHRSLSEVSYIIDNLVIDGKVAEHAIGVYEVLARAEAKAHDTFPESVHFHEVGNDYAIAYIVGFCMAIDKIAPKRILATPVTTGFGFVECAHGRISIPAPATANALSDCPSQVGDIEGELATPTGAAIIAYFAEKFIDIPSGISQGRADERTSSDDTRELIGRGFDIPRFGPIKMIASTKE